MENRNAIRGRPNEQGEVQMNAVVAEIPLRPARRAAVAEAEVPGPEPALAQLAQALVRILMNGVQRTTELNLATCRALLGQTQLPAPAEVERHVDAWRFSARAWDICATTAAQVLRLVNAHARATRAALSQTLVDDLERLAQLDAAATAELRARFEHLDALGDAYFEAAIDAQRGLLNLFSGAR
jgi:hypothetical protein